MATLKDVAKASGLTVGTVSRVLNNRGYISDKTREKVYQVMKELNYQPNETARTLAKQKSNIIGIVLPNVEHPYFARICSSLSALLSQLYFSRRAAVGAVAVLCYLYPETEKNRKRNALICVREAGWQAWCSAAEALKLKSSKD